MNKLSKERQVQVVKALIEGNGINGITRMTGVAKNTVLKLLADLGAACLDYQDKNLHNLKLNRIECDEIWEFCYAKEKNVPKNLKNKFGYGDVWTFVAIDADTKLVPCWLVGNRNYEYAKIFMDDLSSRLANRVQLTTDGHRMYFEAVDRAFLGNVDYAILIKLYGNNPDTERRYSPATCLGTRKEKMNGKPNPTYVSTSYIERQNLTMRMSMKRFARLTNGFSKKVENHMYAIALHFMYYNFARPHASLKNPYERTPAMAAGVTDHIWTVEDIVSLIDNNIP